MSPPFRIADVVGGQMRRACVLMVLIGVLSGGGTTFGLAESLDRALLSSPPPQEKQSSLQSHQQEGGERSGGKSSSEWSLNQESPEFFGSGSSDSNLPGGSSSSTGTSETDAVEPPPGTEVPVDSGIPWLILAGGLYAGWKLGTTEE